jgi:hypothetical protein
MATETPFQNGEKMKKTILVLAALSNQLAFGEVVDYAHCYEPFIDHGFLANIMKDTSTNKISQVIVSAVTIDDTFLVADLKNCQAMPSDIQVTFCEEGVEKGYAIGITEGGVERTIEATLMDPKTDREIELRCKYL